MNSTTVDHRPAHSTYSWNTEGTAEMQTAFGVLFVLSRLLCHSDSPAFCYPVPPPKSPLPPPLPAIAPVTLGYLADQNLSPSTQNIWKAPREICLQKKTKNQELLQKINLGHKRLMHPSPHTMFEDTNHLHFSWYVMIWYLSSGHIMSWYVCKDPKINNQLLEVRWIHTPNSTHYIPASKRHWWPQHGGRWWKFLQVVNLRSTEWKYKGSNTRVPSNIAWKKMSNSCTLKVHLWLRHL